MNVINFPAQTDYEDLSLAERMLILESWHEEMEDNLTRIRESAAKMVELMEANRKHLS
ncbi:hypothetical protein [Sinorhizobium fredii]|uniref:hypothetical protein n=1 Tax=Rhizobium fredii TaxID=380 RepID=UPI0004ADB284|nr:hypothetical protein [Sinorhizobium fredii]